jgi:hypothetical protein
MQFDGVEIGIQQHVAFPGGVDDRVKEALKYSPFVIPAKAGIQNRPLPDRQRRRGPPGRDWIPAFAGMTGAVDAGAANGFGGHGEKPGFSRNAHHCSGKTAPVLKKYCSSPCSPCPLVNTISLLSFAVPAVFAVVNLLCRPA